MSHWFMRGCRYNSGNHAGGFTLLELLVAITVVSLLATTILFGWRVATSAWGRASELLENDRRIAATHRLLQEQMAAMVPLEGWANQAAGEVFFQGEPQAARFVSRYSLENRARSGLYRVEYQILRREDGTHELLLNEFPLDSAGELEPLLAGAEAAPAGRMLRFTPFERASATRVLLEGLEECRLEYYRPAIPPEPGTWVEQWTSRGRELPRGMAIRAVARAEQAQLRPVSVVAEIPNYARAPVRTGLFGLF